MPPTLSIDEAIDRLYQLPLGEFVQARKGLARQFRGEDAKAIRELAKPNLAAWALNQVYWSARPVFDRVADAAARLKEAQQNALLGRQSDPRAAGAAHREALKAAVAQASKLLESAGHEANRDIVATLRAAFEALPWKDTGHLVRPPEPTLGFGALAGMADAQPERARRRSREAGLPKRRRQDPASSPRGNAKAGGAAAEAERAKQREQEARERRAREAVESAQRDATAAAQRLRAAETRVAQAREAERAARERLEEAQSGVRDAETALRTAQRDAAAAAAAVRKAGGGRGLRLVR
jgi:hypothetical protein